MEFKKLPKLNLRGYLIDFLNGLVYACNVKRLEEVDMLDRNEYFLHCVFH